MDKPAERPTSDHREQRQYQLYQQVNKGDLGGGAPQGLQNRYVIEVPLAVAFGCQGYRHSCQNHSEKRT